MGLTVAQVSNPMGSLTEFPIGPFKGRIVNITFDNQYLTTGEVLTAASLGWNVLFGAIQITGGAALANGTLSVDCIVRSNAAQTQLTFQAQETAGTVDTPQKEVTSNQDLSLYSGRWLVLGM